MHLGIVLHPFGTHERGLEQYIAETARAIISSSDATCTLFVKGTPDTSIFPHTVKVVSLGQGMLWQWNLLWHRKTCDRFLFFTESAPVFLWRKSIVVFLDAAFYYFGVTTMRVRIYRKMRMWWIRFMFLWVSQIVTISYASKRDIVSLFRISEDCIKVIYPGYRRMNTLVTTAEQNVCAPYFIYVGPFKERKNVARIVDAFIEWKQKNNTLPHMLYLVGRPTKSHYAQEIMYRISHAPPEIRTSIVQIKDVTDTELATLYQGATALVFPSLLEGFGLPILEALSVGCPVITSATTSTREVVGIAGIVLNPRSVDDIVNAFHVFATDTERVRIYRKEAYLQAEKFSWKRSGIDWKVCIEVLDIMI